MNSRRQTRVFLWSAAAAAATAIAAVGTVTSPAFGQAKGKATAGRATAAAAPRGTAATGLDALGDDALLTELAGRNMQGLLNHAFDVNKTPEAQRAAMLALPAITRLADENNPPKPHERRQLIQQIAAGVDRVVAGIDDPKVLMEHSATMLKQAVQPEVNLMEFWGESPAAQARLKPSVTATLKMLDKAIKSGSATRDSLAELLNKGNDRKVADAWTEVDNLVTMAEYTRAMSRYPETLAIPGNAKGMDERKKIATEAIEYLENFDNADSGIQSAVRNRMAKLLMVQREFGPANDLFESVVSGQADPKTKIEPAPQPFEAYEARYFGIVSELMQGDTERAAKGLEELIGWQQQAVPDPKAQEGLAAAAEVLRYRIHMKERDKAQDPAAKKAAQDKAFEVLRVLGDKQPDLRPIIAEQIVGQLGDNVDMKGAELLIVQALFSRGLSAAEAIEQPGKADPAVRKQVEQGIAAAREIMTRKDPRITSLTISGAAIQLGLLHKKLGQKVEAVNAFMDYVERKLGSERNIKAAFEEAEILLFDLTKGGGDRRDPEISKAWERWLPVAINTFKRNEFAYDYANRLRAKSPPRHADAIKYYRMVPPKDAKMYARAKNRELYTLTDWIYAVGPDKKPLLNPAERAAKVAETLKVGQEVTRLETAAMEAAKDDAERAEHRRNVAVVILVQAELAASGDKPDWQGVLNVLDGFEQKVAGVENEAALTKKVMELRVAGNMQLKQFDKAANMLIVLLDQDPGGRASGLVLGVLVKLKEDYGRAVAEGRMDAARDIIADCAKLSGRLVDWGASHADERVKKNVYTYKVFDADTQRLYGASLEGAARAQQLEKARGLFQNMRTPENVAAYKAAVEERKRDNPQDKTDPDAPDPQVTLGLALTSYDLAEWKTAAVELKRLRFAQKIGSRTRTEVDPKTGEIRIVPNDQYWEAMYKYYDAVTQWAKASPDDNDAKAEMEAVRTLLSRDYVAGPDEAGGEKWREGFERLRKELLPDLDLDKLRRAVTPSAAEPTTEPAAPPTTNETPVEPVAAGSR